MGCAVDVLNAACLQYFLTAPDCSLRPCCSFRATFKLAMAQVWVCPYRLKEAVVPGGLLPTEAAAAAAQSKPPAPITAMDRRAVCRCAALFIPAAYATARPSDSDLDHWHLSMRSIGDSRTDQAAVDDATRSSSIKTAAPVNTSSHVRVWQTHIYNLYMQCSEFSFVLRWSCD